MGAMASPMLAQPFPNFTIDTLSIKQAKSIGPMLIVVWRVQCPTSQLLIPFIERMAKHYPAATVVGIVQNTAEELKEAVDESQLTMKMYADPNLRVSSFLGVEFVPTYWLVGRGGTTLVQGIGWDRDKVLLIAHSLAVEASTTYVPIFTREDRLPTSRAA